MIITLQWHHHKRDGVANQQPHDCFLNRSFRRRSNKTSKLRVTGLREWHSPVTREFPAQRASNAENVSIWWRHHRWQNSIDDAYTREWNRSSLAQVKACCLSGTRQLPEPMLNYCLIANWIVGVKFQRNFNPTANISIEEIAFENLVCNMAAMTRARCDIFFVGWSPRCGIVTMTNVGYISI